MIAHDPHEGKRGDLLRELRRALGKDRAVREDRVGVFGTVRVPLLGAGLNALAGLATDAPKVAEEKPIASAGISPSDVEPPRKRPGRRAPPQPTQLASYIVDGYFGDRSVLSYRTRYNLACFFATVGRLDDALEELGIALEAGNLADVADRDAALQPLRQKFPKKFKALVAPDFPSEAEAQPSESPDRDEQRVTEVEQLVRENPGITTAELAQRMGIRPDYLYRLMLRLRREDKVRTGGSAWYPT